MEDKICFTNGWTMHREYGKTPNGNNINGRWVLRDNAGNWMDFDKYRSDLLERWSMDNHIDFGFEED